MIYIYIYTYIIFYFLYFYINYLIYFYYNNLGKEYISIFASTSTFSVFLFCLLYRIILYCNDWLKKNAQQQQVIRLFTELNPRLC